MSDELKVKHYKVKVVKQKQNPLKFIISVISYAIFIWLLLIGGTLLIYVADIKIRAMKGDYTAPKFNAYVVETGSMIPEILVKDVVLTKKIPTEDIKVGDVITFLSADPRLPGITITHRVVDIYTDPVTGEVEYQTQGDNNNSVDATLTPSYNVLGKVILKLPKLGYLQEFLVDMSGWIYVILLPCLAIVSYDIMKLFKIVGKKAKVIKS